MYSVNDTIECITINDRLRNYFGNHPEGNYAHFRVVFSDDQLEKRYGTRNLYADDAQQIFLREETGLFETKKYPQFEGSWILERYFPNIHHDVYEGEFTYEPIYVFPSGLPLKWEAIELCAKVAVGLIPTSNVVPKTEKEAIANHELHLQKEKEKVLNMLDNTAMMSALHDGGGVSMANSYKEKEETSDATR